MLPGQAVPWLAAVPDAAVAVVRCVDPPASVTALLAALGPAPAGLPATAQARLGVGIAVVRAFCGGDAVAFVDRLARGGAALGLLPTGNGLQPMLVLRPGDVAAARRWCADTLPTWRVRGTADTLVLTPAAVPAPEPGARWASSSFGPEAAVQAEIDLAAARALAGARWPAWERLDGPARVLAVAVVPALAAAAIGHVGLHVDGGVRLAASVDASVRALPLAELLADAAPRAELAPPAGALASLRLDRSLVRLLRTPERFLTPPQVVVAQSFLSIADAVDGPASFVDDLLGGLGEPFVLHVLPASTDAAADEAPLALPEFALVAPLRQPAAGDLVLRAARVLATIASVERQQRGKVPFLMRPMRTETGHGLVAEPGPWRGPGVAPVDVALSPTVWIERDHVVLASTQRAALACVQAPALAAAAPAGDRLVVHGAPLAEWLARNRAIVELGRMLDEGEDRAAAREFFDVLQAVLGALGALHGTVDADADRTRMELRLERAR